MRAIEQAQLLQRKAAQDLAVLRKLIGDPVLRTQGVPVEEDKLAFLAEAADEATSVLSKGSQEEEALRERIRLAVRRTATRWTGKKPVVDVLLIRA